MDFKDYYKILGVQPSASADDIKKSYRKLARKYHPDVSSESDAEDKFKELSEAYEVLKDPEKRSEYDMLREMGARGNDGSFRPPPGWESGAHFNAGGFTGADASAFSDFFEEIFGRGGGAQRGQGHSRHSHFSMRGEDIHFKLALLLEESFRGGERTIQFRVPEIDERGQVTYRNKTLNVKIPAGIGDGQHMRLKGQGAPGTGGAASGDLLIEIQLVPHPLYHVDGKNLLLQLPIAPWEAVLGATVSVPTLGGKVNLKIPANSKAGAKLKLKGKGLPGKTAGDLVVQLTVVVPQHPTDKEKALYEQLQKQSEFDPRADLQGA